MNLTDGDLADLALAARLPEKLPRRRGRRVPVEGACALLNRLRGADANALGLSFSESCDDEARDLQVWLQTALAQPGLPAAVRDVLHQAIAHASF